MPQRPRVMGHRNREEVVNTQLAILVSDYGVEADAETIQARGLARPDVMFELRGLRVIIEGKFADHPGAEEAAFLDARERVQSGLAHIAAAAVYPFDLRTCPTTQIIDRLRVSQLRFRIVSETAENTQWSEGDPAALMAALRRAQQALVEDDIVEQAAMSLALRLEAVAQLWTGQPGACDRLSRLLGMTIPADEDPTIREDRRETAAKVSALVLANAYIFQEQLNPSDERILTLAELARERDLLAATRRHWTWIWQHINYVAVFQLGDRILDLLPANQNTLSALRALLAEAQHICGRKAALRHDLMGRIYHRLLHDAKFLGTFYTAVPSATLLLNLTFAANWPQNFGSARQLSTFKVADLACGTGTLLMASAQGLSDRHIRTRVAEGRGLTRVELTTLHRTLMENVLHGYDVLPSAVHLTASTLAMLAPEVSFVRMNLFAMPLGSDHGDHRLGSLDFLTTDHVMTQLTLDDDQADTHRVGASGTRIVDATVPPLDLCVMNPPFTRSVGGNLLFGSLPAAERDQLQAELARQLRSTRVSANTTAGLGSVFVALADRRLKPGGRLAFVLPAALISGEAWGVTRRLIADRYHLETVITSHDAEQQNFSESTSLSEVMFIARKRLPGEGAGPTTYINLRRNPRSIHEALDLANRIGRVGAPARPDGLAVSPIRANDRVVGEIVRMPPPVAEGAWLGALFARSDLLRACWSLGQGRLAVPGQRQSFDITLCALGQLGTFGFDRRDIHDAFHMPTDDVSAFPAFWNHKAKDVRCMAQAPNAWLRRRRRAAQGRPLKDADAVFDKAGSILVAERLRLNSHRLIAVGLGTKAISNTWWSFNPDGLSPKRQKALLLWLNSTPALLLAYARRVITEGAFVQLKKPAWTAMPVLDVRALSREQVDLLARAYDQLSTAELKPLCMLNDDATRMRIDQALSDALDLPDLDLLRQMLAQEPGLSARAAAVRQPSRRAALLQEVLEDVDD